MVRGVGLIEMSITGSAIALPSGTRIAKPAVRLDLQSLAHGRPPGDIFRFLDRRRDTT